jgi:hypothetical protein
MIWFATRQIQTRPETLFSAPTIYKTSAIKTAAHERQLQPHPFVFNVFPQRAFRMELYNTKFAIHITGQCHGKQKGGRPSYRESFSLPGVADTQDTSKGRNTPKSTTVRTWITRKRQATGSRKRWLSGAWSAFRRTRQHSPSSALTTWQTVAIANHTTPEKPSGKHGCMHPWREVTGTRQGYPKFPPCSSDVTMGRSRRPVQPPWRVFRTSYYFIPLTIGHPICSCLGELAQHYIRASGQDNLIYSKSMHGEGR